jgi:hypothetical protein
MTLAPLGILASSGGAAADFELIETVYGTGASGTITFTSIPGTFKHLQIRMTPRSNDANATAPVFMTFNNDSGSNYASHFLQGYQSGIWSSNATSQTSMSLRSGAANSGVSNVHAAHIVDILDYTSTNKNKTVKTLQGHVLSGQFQISLISGLWQSTSAISSISISTVGSFITASRFSLYGIKG